MQRTAKILMNNRSHAIQIPEEFHLSTREIFIRTKGEDVILLPRQGPDGAHARAEESDFVVRG